MSGRRTAARKALIPLAAAGLIVASAAPALSDYQPGIPPAVDPGDPTFAGSDHPVPDEGVPFDPTTSMLQSIYDADVQAGGDSFWFDRLLERPFLSNADSHLYTRGRALYMYTHAPGILGFAGSGTGANGGGGFAYRESPNTSVTHLYTVATPGVTLSEATAERRQYPSHWSSVHTSAAAGLTVAQRKFITYNNVAVTILTLTNTGAAPTTQTLVASSPIASTPSADGTELTGTLNTRYNVTTIMPRLSGEGFTASGPTLVREVTLDPGQSTTVKLQLGAITNELPESAADYGRFRGYDPDTAFRTQLAEYNQWWVDNVPYIDVPDENIKKMSYYRTFLNRYNYIDANIPGNDYQFPVSIEGVLGYNNAIQLTQPMHLQDLKYFRDPLYSYGNWVSSGETSKCTAFTSNPGSFSWGNTYEQYIAREAWNAYKIHGGDRGIVNNFAHYAECDIEGQLAKFDRGNRNFLIEYANGALTGNDADAVALQYSFGPGVSVSQDRTEAAFQYSGAKAAAEAYRVLGDEAKAAEMETLAANIQNAILTLLWDETPVVVPPPEPTPATRAPGQAGFGNAIPLNVSAPNRYVELPDGVMSGLTDFTISAWVNRATTSGQTWARVFDFGTGQQVNMFLTVNGGGAGLRYAITTGGGGAEQRITAAPQLPTGWQHVAVTLSGTTGTLYLNGAPVGTNTNMTLNPSSLGTTTNNWIGRSQYPDPLLNGAVDEFHIFDHALTQAEIQALAAGPAGTAGGNVTAYAFDETDGPLVVDSSGNGRDGTVVTPLVGGRPGHVFKQRNVATNELVPWKDQQNFSPFTEGVVPDTDDYKQALRYYADAAEFPIMPFYTANQRDKAEAATGSNNFSNINSTLQAQLYSKALREYPSEFITPDMYRKLLDWLTWTQYVGGDNRYPDNNEFFFNWNPTTRTLGRSGIHHNILGAYNFMLIDDIAGIRPRLDDVIELWPIDIGWDHFAINNLSYHGKDLTLVWDRSGDGARHYPQAPEGYTAYLDGKRAFTIDDLAHVTWNAATGTVTVLDGSDTQVLFADDALLQEATEISLSANDRVADMFQKAGVDLDLVTGWVPNLAEGKAVSASFATTTPDVRAAAPQNAVDGFTISGLPITQGGGAYIARNTIWGTQGSPNAQDWLAVDLGEPTTFDTVKLYFFSDKSYNTQSNGSGNTYRQPSSYTVQYHDGTDWVDIPQQVPSPATPQPNYNTVAFEPVTAQHIRLLVTPTQGFGVGLKEIQVLDAVSCDTTVTGMRVGPLTVSTGTTCLAAGARVTGPVTVQPGAGLIATDATLVGSVSATGARTVQLLDSTVIGPVTIAGTTGRAAVEGTRVVGPLRLTNNSTGDTPIVVSDNGVVGLLACSGNAPPPVNNGVPNSVTGPRTGQCAGL